MNPVLCEVVVELKYTVEQQKALAEIEGLRDQIQKGNWLNVHFRAFRLANDGWNNHIMANAKVGSSAVGSPGGAVLDDDRDGRSVE